VGTEHDVHPRGLVNDRVAILLRQTATDGDLHAGLLATFNRREVAEVAVEPVVGVLAHRARVEDDHVGLVALGARHSPPPPAAR
jgi:hypothetical protein